MTVRYCLLRMAIHLKIISYFDRAMSIHKQPISEVESITAKRSQRFVWRCGTTGYSLLYYWGEIKNTLIVLRFSKQYFLLSPFKKIDMSEYYFPRFLLDLWSIVEINELLLEATVLYTNRKLNHRMSFLLLTALPQLLKQTADATPMYPRATAYDGHCASTGGPWSTMVYCILGLK